MSAIRRMTAMIIVWPHHFAPYDTLRILSLLHSERQTVSIAFLRWLAILHGEMALARVARQVLPTKTDATSPAERY